MGRFLSTISILLLFAAPIIGLRSVAQSSSQSTSESGDTRIVDITADVVYPYKVDDTPEVYCLVGDFAAQHNGAIITADSAVRYSDKRLECFGNVIINKNTTYAYADRATYDGDSNLAELFAPIIKVVDEDVTLYTYDFIFNTETNIGHYGRGGVTINGDNIVESINGFFDSNNKTLTGYGDVLMRNEEYEMSGDSVIYNTESEAAEFFDATNIWNSDGDYLYTDRGEYNKEQSRYTFTRNGYILTEEQEIWSDSLDYYRQREYVLMRSNIQLDDTTHKSMSFGDFGEYWRNPGNVTLTLNPALINYDTQDQTVDSLFMRADTIIVLTLNSLEIKRLEEQRIADSLAFVRETFIADSIALVQAKQLDSINSAAALLNGHDHDHDHDGHAHTDDEHGGRGERGQGGQQGGRGERGQGGQQGGRGERGQQGGSIGTESNEGNHEHSHSSDEAAHGTPHSELTDSLDMDIDREQDSLKVMKPLIPLDSQQRRFISMGALAYQIEQIDKQVASGEVDSLSAISLKREAAKQDSIDQRQFIRDLRESDSIATLKQRLDTLDVKAQKRVIKSVIDKRKAYEKRLEQKARYAELAIIAKERQLKRTEQLNAQAARAARQNTQPQSGEQGEKLSRRERRKLKDIELIESDSISTEIDADSLSIDPLSLDSLDLDSLALDSLAIDTLVADSIYRLVIGIRNSQTFRSDFQTKSDSLVTNSADSTIRLYHSPIMWHEKNQIVSEQSDIYTAYEQITHAVFNGNPIMSSKVTDDTIHFNQIKGRVITTLFRDQEVYRNDVDGNAQTLYYTTDDQSGELTGLMVIESGSASFYIEEQEMDRIAYRTSPVYTIHPIDKIPAEQSLYLKDFKWWENIQPQRETIFTRTIRPSIREQKRALEHPSFPINEEMEQQKSNLIEDGMWSDRNDLIDAKREAWFNSLGYKSGEPRKEDEDPFSGF